MRTTWTRAALIVLCVAFHAPIGRGAATQPTTRPAPIDQVVNFPPINLKTKGLMPEEAFKLLSQATGIRISPAQQISSPGVGVSKKIDLWGDRPYSKIDFDLESVSLLQAVERLSTQADVHAWGEDNWMGIRPGPAGYNTRTSHYFSKNPVFTAEAEPGLSGKDNQEIPPENWPALWPAVMTDCRVGVLVDFHLDPRIKICATRPPVIEAALDGAGGDMEMQPFRTGVSRTLGQWVSFMAATRKHLSTLSVLRGYAIVTVVTKSREIELPMQSGAKVVDGHWTIEVLSIKRGSGAQAGPFTTVSLSVEPNDKSAPPVPEYLHQLVELRDANGAPLLRAFSSDDLPRSTPTNGVIASPAFWWDLQDETRVTPAKLVFILPLETKEAALPFDFKDIQMP